MSFQEDFTQDLKDGLSPFKKQFQQVLNYLKNYLKNPVEAIRHPPNWDWNTLIIVYTGAAATCGVLAGVISFRITQILVGLIFFPISACVGAIILSAFFYYTFLFFFRYELSLRLIFTIVTLSLLPFFALYTFSVLIEPLKLIGFAATGFLLIVGFAENSPVDRKKLIQIIVGLYIFYFIFWGMNMIRWRTETKNLKDLATPESYDQLKKELSE